MKLSWNSGAICAEMRIPSQETQIGHIPLLLAKSHNRGSARSYLSKQKAMIIERYAPDQNGIVNEKVGNDSDGGSRKHSIISKQKSGQTERDLSELPAQVSRRNEIHEFQD